MPEKEMTMAEALERLRREGLLADTAIESIDGWLAGRKRRVRAPWYLQGFIGLGAWLASMSFAAFFSAAGFIIGSEEFALFLFGAMGIALGIFLNYLRKRGSGDAVRVFLGQVSLAAGLTGALLFISGLALMVELGIGGVTLASSALCLLLYFLNDYGPHRFLTTLVTFALIAAWAGTYGHGLEIIVVCLVMLAGAVLSGALPFFAFLRPAALAAAANFLWILSPFAMDDAISPWPSRIAMIALVLFVGWRLSGDWRPLVSEPLVVVMAAVVIVGLVGQPGILAALALMALGFGRGDHLLLILGALALPVYVTAYYYELELGLMEKSLVMAASGAVLLGAWMLARWRLSVRERTL